MLPDYPICFKRPLGTIPKIGTHKRMLARENNTMTNPKSSLRNSVIYKQNTRCLILNNSFKKIKKSLTFFNNEKLTYIGILKTSV